MENNYKYSYYFVDLDETIYANSGEECERKYAEIHGTSLRDNPYNGIIILTNLETKQVNTMYPIVVIK